MKLVKAVTALAFAAVTRAQINCYTCTSNEYNDSGDADSDDCWNLSFDTQNVDLTECSAEQVCFSKITWDDGFPQSIERGCVNNQASAIESEVPLNFQENAATYQGCTTDIEAETNVHQTQCGQICATTNCNSPSNFGIRTLKSCNCQNANEICDYTTGVCSCPLGQEVNSESAACETTTTTTTTTVATTTVETTTVVTTEAPNLSCVQCSSEFDAGCASGGVAATECTDAAAVSCAAVSILVIDENGQSVREIVERGCSTDNLVDDTCEFRAADSSYSTAAAAALDGVNLIAEFTCRYTCKTNGCNTEIATGDGPAVAVETSTVYKCASGSSVDGDSDTEVSCEFGCKSELSYLENPYVTEYDRNDVSGTDKRGKILKYTRGCAAEEDVELNTCTRSNSITTAFTVEDNQPAVGEATKPTIKDNTAVFVCEKVCKSDDCNNADHYPGRPSCYVCDSTTDPNCYVSLEKVTDITQQCDFDEDSCEIMHSGLDMEVDGSWAHTAQVTPTQMIPFSSLATGFHDAKIQRRCVNTYLENMNNPVEFDEENYSCSDKDVSLSETIEEQQITHRECTFRCDSDYCNFGPGLKFANFVNETTTEEPETPGSSGTTWGFSLFVVFVGLLVNRND